MSDLRTRLHWVPDRLYNRWDGKVPDWLLYSGWADWWWRAVCLIWSHSPICDQCNLPEHDYCAWCGKPMPGAAHPLEKA